MKTFTAEENIIHTIHPAISTLPRLQHLRLRKNNISSAAIETFMGLQERAAITNSLKVLMYAMCVCF